MFRVKLPMARNTAWFVLREVRGERPPFRMEKWFWVGSVVGPFHGFSHTIYARPIVLGSAPNFDQPPVDSVVRRGVCEDVIALPPAAGSYVFQLARLHHHLVTTITQATPLRGLPRPHVLYQSHIGVPVAGGLLYIFSFHSFFLPLEAKAPPVSLLHCPQAGRMFDLLYVPPCTPGTIRSIVSGRANRRTVSSRFGRSSGLYSNSPHR